MSRKERIVETLREALGANENFKGSAINITFTGPVKCVSIDLKKSQAPEISQA